MSLINLVNLEIIRTFEDLETTYIMLNVVETLYDYFYARNKMLIWGQGTKLTSLYKRSDFQSCIPSTEAGIRPTIRWTDAHRPV